MSEFKETVGELFNLQGNKFFRTIRGLTIAPGDTIRAFAAGDRKSFLHPFTYALTLIGISLFLGNFATADHSNQLIIDVQNKTEQNTIQFLNQEKSGEKFKESDDILNKKKSQSKLPEFLKELEYGTQPYKKFIQYLGFFIASIVHLLVFKNLGFGLKKNSWFIFYAYSHTIFLTSLLSPLTFISSNTVYLSIIVLLSFVFGVSFQIWSTTEYYEISFGRAIKKYIFSSLIIMLFLIVIGIVSVILVYLIFIKG